MIMGYGYVTTKFISWKPRVILILEENDLLNFVNEKSPEPEAEEAKSQWRKRDVKERRILVAQLKITWFYKSHKTI